MSKFLGTHLHPPPLESVNRYPKQLIKPSSLSAEFGLRSGSNPQSYAQIIEIICRVNGQCSLCIPGLEGINRPYGPYFDTSNVKKHRKLRAISVFLFQKSFYPGFDTLKHDNLNQTAYCFTDLNTDLQRCCAVLCADSVLIHYNNRKCEHFIYISKKKKERLYLRT